MRRSNARRTGAGRFWRRRAAATRRCRREVEALLAHEQSAEGFLGGPVSAAGVAITAGHDRRGASEVHSLVECQRLNHSVITHNASSWKG